MQQQQGGGAQPIEHESQAAPAPAPAAADTAAAAAPVVAPREPQPGQQGAEAGANQPPEVVKGREKEAYSGAAEKGEAEGAGEATNGVAAAGGEQQQQQHPQREQPPLRLPPSQAQSPVISGVDGASGIARALPALLTTLATPATIRDLLEAEAASSLYLGGGGGATAPAPIHAPPQHAARVSHQPSYHHHHPQQQQQQQQLERGGYGPPQLQPQQRFYASPPPPQHQPAPLIQHHQEYATAAPIQQQQQHEQPLAALLHQHQQQRQQQQVQQPQQGLYQSNFHRPARELSPFPQQHMQQQQQQQSSAPPQQHLYGGAQTCEMGHHSSSHTHGLGPQPSVYSHHYSSHPSPAAFPPPSHVVAAAARLSQQPSGMGVSSAGGGGLPPYRGSGSAAALHSRGGGGDGYEGGGGGGGLYHSSYVIDEVSSHLSSSQPSAPAVRLGMKRPEPSGGRGSEDGGDSDREDDRKRRWMTKDQARACQQKFDEWGGSLRGKQEEVAQFAKSIGLTALQVEKRFHYIRKHYDKVTKRLTTDDSARRGFDLMSSSSALFQMCPASTQIALVQRVNEWAQHELDGDRLMKMLILLAAQCRFCRAGDGSDGDKGAGAGAGAGADTEGEVFVKPSRHQIAKLEAAKYFEQGVPPHMLVDLLLGGGAGSASNGAGLDVLHDVDLVWLGRQGRGRQHHQQRLQPEPFALFMIDSGLQGNVSSVTKWADVRLRGYNLPCFTIVPKGRINHVKSQIGLSWMQSLLKAVPGMTTTRIIPEENLEYVLAQDPKSLSLLTMDALELLYTLSESAVISPGPVLLVPGPGPAQPHGHGVQHVLKNEPQPPQQQPPPSSAASSSSASGTTTAA